MAVECLSLRKEKENLANELVHEECTTADNARQALKQVQQTACSQREGSGMLPQTARKQKL